MRHNLLLLARLSIIRHFAPAQIHMHVVRKRFPHRLNPQYHPILKLPHRQQSLRRPQIPRAIPVALLIPPVIEPDDMIPLHRPLQPLLYLLLRRPKHNAPSAALRPAQIKLLMQIPRAIVKMQQRRLIAVHTPPNRMRPYMPQRLRLRPARRAIPHIQLPAIRRPDSFYLRQYQRRRPRRHRHHNHNRRHARPCPRPLPRPPQKPVRRKRRRHHRRHIRPRHIAPLNPIPRLPQRNQRNQRRQIQRAKPAEYPTAPPVKPRLPLKPPRRVYVPNRQPYHDRAGDYRRPSPAEQRHIRLSPLPRQLQRRPNRLRQRKLRPPIARKLPDNRVIAPQPRPHRRTHCQPKRARPQNPPPYAYIAPKQDNQSHHDRQRNPHIPCLPRQRREQRRPRQRPQTTRQPIPIRLRQRQRRQQYKRRARQRPRRQLP